MAQPIRLTSALLARKGHALPTGGFAQSRLGPALPAPALARRKTEKRSVTTAPRAALSTDLVRPSSPKPSRHPERAGQGRVAFTVRLDRKRYTRLKSLAGRSGRSGQEILIAALDAYLKKRASAPRR